MGLVLRRNGRARKSEPRRRPRQQRRNRRGRKRRKRNAEAKAAKRFMAGRETVTASGDTFQFHDEFSRRGWSWDGAEKAWWILRRHFSREMWRSGAGCGCSTTGGTCEGSELGPENVLLGQSGVVPSTPPVGNSRVLDAISCDTRLELHTSWTHRCRPQQSARARMRSLRSARRGAIVPAARVRGCA